MEPCLVKTRGSEKTRLSEKKEKFQFSLWQSTILYSIFLYNAIVIGMADVVVQIVNLRYNQCKRMGEECSVDKEEMTLLDILMKMDPINQAYIVILITNITAFISFALSLKMEKGRASCLSSTCCKFLQEMINGW